eukprot:jgi/Astpho2/4134/fgenesh1_pg.00063_%23_115_t
MGGHQLGRLSFPLLRHDDSGLAAYLDPRDHRNNSAAMLLQCLQSGVVSPRDTAAAETAEALAGISSRVKAQWTVAQQVETGAVLQVDCLILGEQDGSLRLTAKACPALPRLVQAMDSMQAHSTAVAVAALASGADAAKAVLRKSLPRGTSWPKLTATKQHQCLSNSIRELCQAATSQHRVNTVDAEALQALVQCTIPRSLLKGSANSRRTAYYSPLLEVLQCGTQEELSLSSLPIINQTGGKLQMPGGHARMMALLVLLATSPCHDSWRRGTRHQPADGAVKTVQGADGSSVTSQPPLVHGGTLILVASCMLNEWDLQLSEAGPLRQPLKVLKLHSRGPADSFAHIASFDVVLATHSALKDSSAGQTCFSAVLNRIHWHRVVVDDVHKAAPQASSPAAARLGLLFAQSKWLLGEHRLCKAGRTDDLKVLFSLMGISSSFDEHYATKFAVTAHICKELIIEPN